MTTDGTPTGPDDVPPHGTPPPLPEAYGAPASGGYALVPGPPQPGYGAQPGYPRAGYPQAGYAAPPAPDNYLVWAILSTVLCCLPLGIVSIVYAAQVNDKWLRGDVAGAMESSRKAKQFATWSAIVHVGLLALVLVVYVGFFAVLIGTGVSTAP